MDIRSLDGDQVQGVALGGSLCSAVGKVIGDEKNTELRDQGIGHSPPWTRCQRKQHDLGGKGYCEPLGRRAEKKEDVSLEGTCGSWLECQRRGRVGGENCG